MIIVTKKGFGFVNIEGAEDVHISQANTNKAIHGDKVIVEITSQKGEKLDGRIVRIVDRNLENIVGEYYIEDFKGKVKLDNDKINISIDIPKELSLGALPGHKVLVKVTNKLKDNNYISLNYRIV